MEILGSLSYYFKTLRTKLGTRGGDVAGRERKMDFATAFGVYQPRAETDRQLGVVGHGELQSSYDEVIRLAPYGYHESSPDPSVGA